MQESSSGAERFWQAETLRLSRRIHGGWWLDGMLQAWIPLALGGAVLLLGLRWGAGWQGPQGAWLILALAALAFGYGLWAMQRRREPLDATRVRLEDALGLKTRLTAAAAGVGEWPGRRDGVDLPLQFGPSRRLVMAALSVALLLTALWVPVSTLQVAESRTIEKPTAIRELEQWVDELRKEDAVEEETLEQVEEKMEQLLQRPKSDWYEHANLEAADHLQEMTAADLQQLAQNLEAAERAASALAAGSGMPSAAKQALREQLGENGQSMQSGGMRPGQGLAEQLQQMDPSALSQMSPEQLRKLAEQLQQNSQALQEALKNAPSFDYAECFGAGPGKGKGKGKGKPGVTRGPGTLPITLEEDVNDLGTDRVEKMQAQLDAERLAMGDVVDVVDAEQDHDPLPYQGPQQGGDLRSAGDGGSAVWQNQLVPEEREALRRFFKD